MRCTNCGNEIADGILFCTVCGAKQSSEAASTAGRPSPSASSPRYTYSAPTPSESHRSVTHNTPWISGIRVFAWILFCLIVVGGFIFGSLVIDNSHGDGLFIGLMIIVASFIVAFFSVAWTMILLDLASDIHTIRKNLEK